MAIAYDTLATATTGGGASSLTFSHTCTGSDLILFVFTVNHSHLGTMTGVTYGGVSMTLMESNDAPDNKGQRLWYLIAPATGANNVVASKSDGSGWIDAVAVSYTGASQTGQPDAKVVPATETTTSYSKSITTVADNCWIIWPMTNSGLTITAGSNTTVLQQPTFGAHGASFAAAHSDQTPAGSKTLAVTSSSQRFASIMASFSPAGGGGGGATYRRKALLGVGQ